LAKVLIESCEVVVTMDDQGTEIAGGSILIDDGVIAWVGPGAPPQADGAQRVDGRGTVAIPGMVNTHHQLYQTMTRARALDQGLFGWLTELYPVWAGVDREWERAASRVGLAELALSGCSTTTDHHYVFPDGVEGLLEAEVDAAAEIGVRFHPCRGSMDLGRAAGGLPPDSVVQETDTILSQTEETVGRFHDPEPGAMLRIAVAPCSPFSATDRLMRESAELARRLGVRLHTHIAETTDEEAYCLATFGKRPIELLDDQGWLGPDVWLAHCVHLDDRDIRRIAQTGSGVAWCPTSNMRIGSGIAPARALLDAGADMLAEARQALFSARAVGGAGAMTIREVLRVATRGGAACLGRDDVGSLEPGKRADIALVGLDGLGFAGAEADPVAAVLLCAPRRVRHLLVEGRPVVRDGRLVNVDEDEVAAEAHRFGRRLAGKG
jgi:cytosine/adenosine deaminase-related metal-dependent hydrolase